MIKDELPPCRLFMIMAREANVAVIFRRGPSKWTQVIKWDTKNDSFEYGHWFKGRIYERRCDLSPDGTKLIYFVSKFNKKTNQDYEYTSTWTAISKVPWLTALALWPKGDCWHGGGMFNNNNSVFLNHEPEQAKAHPKHTPKHLSITPNPNASGEDHPLYSLRLRRDGWKLIKKWKVKYTYRGFATEQPEVRALHHPKKNYLRYLRLVMEKWLSGFKYWEEYKVFNSKTKHYTPLLDVECARWDQRGRLALLSQGKLYIGNLDENGKLKQKMLADFNDLKPETIDSPSWAKQW